MKKLVILLAAALTFNSCSDSFLDLSNPSALSPSVYPKSMADMETIVTSVYANMVAVPLYGKRVMAKGTFCVDHTVDMAWTGDANWNQLATNQVTSDNAYIGTLWIGYYKMISCANTVLEQLERIDKEKFTDADLVRLSQMKGEALFWRGWAHQQLVAFFGEGYPCNGEGVQHWQDVCRWKVLDEEISRWYGKTRVGNPHYDAKDLYFPIPKVEMENNPNMTQSIGYENE